MALRNKRKAIFVHVPKTGGPTINIYLKSAFGEENSITHIQVKEFQKPGFLDNYKFIAGHVLLSQIKYSLDISGFYLLTAFRDPIYQLLSHIEWAIDKNKPELLATRKYFDTANNMMFDDMAALDISSPDQLYSFVKSTQPYRLLYDNQQTRFMLNSHNNGPLDYYDLKIALANLKKYNLVGTTNKMDKYIKILASDLGFPVPEDTPVDQKYPWPGKYLDTGCKPEIKAALVDYIKYDQILYQEAQELFYKKAATI